MQEIQSVKSKLIKVGGEAAHLKHLLTIEKEQHERTRQELDGARAENKDHISQKAQLIATAASADEVQGKYERLQVRVHNTAFGWVSSMDTFTELI